MIKQLPMSKIIIIKRCFQERFMGQMEAPSSWKIVKLVFSRKPDADQRRGSEATEVADISDVEVLRIL